jgi:CheY-like chemotaxis protein
MARPTVLVVDGDEPRRRELVRGLAGYGYEVVTAASAHEGTRFATGLRPDVVVAEAGMVDDTNPFGVRGAPHGWRASPGYGAPGRGEDGR